MSHCEGIQGGLGGLGDFISWVHLSTWLSHPPPKGLQSPVPEVGFQRQAWPSQHQVPWHRMAGRFGVANTGAWLLGLRGRAGASDGPPPSPGCPWGPGGRFLFFSERGRRWPAPRDPGGAASWEGASGVGREGLDKGPVKAFLAGMPGLVARRRAVAAASSRGEALPSSLCHPPSHGAAIVEVALPWLGSCRPLPQGCQMGLARGSQVRALAPAPSPPMGPGGARKRAKQAGRW